MGAAASTKVPKQTSPTSPVTLLPTQCLQIPVALERLYLGLGWRNKGGASLDVDASAVSFSGNQVHNIVYYGSTRDRAAPSAVVHTGDVLTGGKGDVDLERIYIQCGALAKEVDSVYLVINVFTGGKTFADVDAAYCRLVNADSNQELANFRLGDLKTGDAIIFGKLSRHPATGYWHWMALGQLAHGRTAQAVAQQIAGDVRMVQPTPALPPVGVAPALPPVGVAAVAVAAPAAAVQVQVPPGAVPGMLIAVQSPSGQMMQVQVPPGAVPGTVISVPVAGAAPAVAAPATAAPGVAPGASKPQQPTKSLAAPALIGATAVGVAAATAVFLNPGLSRDMLGGVDGGIDIGSMCDPSAISLPDDLIPIDLMAPGEVIDAFGDLAGDAMDGAGGVLVSAGDVAAGLAENAGETMSGALGHLGDAVGNLDAGGIAHGLGEVMHSAGDALANVGGNIANAAGNVINNAPDMLSNVGDAIGNVGEGMGEALQAVGDLVGEVAGGVGDIVG